MKSVMFGVFTKNFVREYLSSSNILNHIHQYQGQMLISDGVHSRVLDDVAVEALKVKHQEAVELLSSQFEKEKQLNSDFRKKALEITGKEPCTESLSWMTNNDLYPITWFTSFEKAQEAWRAEPIKRVVCKSVTVNVS